MLTTLTYQCPHCDQPMDVELHSGQEILTCPNPDCRKPFQVELPTAKPAPGLIVPEHFDHEPEPGPAGEIPPVATAAAAAETELIQVKPVMFRRFPFRFLVYSVGCLAGLVVLVLALFYHRPAVGLLGIAAAGYCGYRLAVWWLRVLATVLSVTTKRTVLHTGLFSAESMEIPHSEIGDIQVKQSTLNRLLDVGDLFITSKGQEKKAIRILAVPRIGVVVSSIRNHRPA